MPNLIAIIFAKKSINNSISIIKHRASFPLLRAVLSGIIDRRNQGLSTEISRSEIKKSLQGHYFRLAVFTPILIWGAILSTRGVIAYIKFSILLPATGSSIALAVLSALNIFISYRSIVEFRRLNGVI